MLIYTKYIKYHAACIVTGLLLMNSALVFAAPMELSLDETVNIAIKNNSAIQITLKDKEKATWSIDEAKAGKYPSLSLGSSYNLKDSISSGGNSDINNSLRLNWQLYTGGRVETQIKQAEQGVTTADLNIEKTKQQVKFDASAGYYSVLQTRNMLTVGQETVDNLTEHLKIVKAKYEAGVVAKSDVLRAEVELSNAEQNLIKAKNNYDLALANLLNIMNMDMGTEVQLKDELQYASYSRTLEECFEFAISNRPDIFQAKTAVAVAANSVKIAESGKLPSVSLSASTGWKDTLLPDDGGNWSVGLSANWNVFDTGATNAKIKQAEAALGKANLQAEQVKDNAEQEVRQSYLSMREAEKRLETTNVAIDKAQEDLYIAREKYKAGVGTNLDVIDAQLALTQAKTNNIQALYDFNVNKTKLEKAIGTKVE